MQPACAFGGRLRHIVNPCSLRVSLRTAVGLRARGSAIPATPSLPQLEDLASKSYDSLISSSAATSSAAGLPSDADSLPLIAGLVAGIVLVGAILYAVTEQDTAPTAVTPSRALKILEQVPDAQLLDIRPQKDSRSSGVADLKAVKKSVLSLPYKPAVAPQEGDRTSTVSIGWAERVGRMAKIGTDKTLVLLDTDGTAAPAAARELAKLYPKRKELITVVGGAKAWQGADLPWKEPVKLIPISLPQIPGLGIDVSELSAGTGGVIKALNNSSSVSQLGAIGLGVAGLAILFFAEFEQLLELVGIGFVLQFLVRKLLFAEQREKTLSDVRTFLDEKIAAQEAGRDLQRLADAVLDVETLSSMDDVADKAAADAKKLARAAAAGASSDMPENVQSARAWIANWRAKSLARVPVHA